MWTFPSIPASIMGQNVPGKLEPLRRVLVPEWIQDFSWGGGASLRNGFKFVAFIFIIIFFFGGGGRVPLTLESHRSSLGVGGGSSQSVTYPQLFSSHAFLPIE